MKKNTWHGEEVKQDQLSRDNYVSCCEQKEEMREREDIRHRG